MPLLFSAFILTGISFAQTPPPAAPPVAAVEKEKPMRHEHHPELHKAIRKLKAAKMDLQKAAHDFGGHKARAIGAIDQAIVELQAALEFDKK